MDEAPQSTPQRKHGISPIWGWSLLPLAVVLYLLSLPWVHYVAVKSGQSVQPNTWLNYYMAPGNWIYLNTPLSGPMYVYEKWCRKRVGYPY